MLFAQIPSWITAICLAVICTVKYLTSIRLWYSGFCQNWAKGTGWPYALSFAALTGALMTFAIFYVLAGMFWSSVFALIDAASLWYSGYFVRARKLVLGPRELWHWRIRIRVFHGCLYSSFIAFVLYEQLHIEP